MAREFDPYKLSSPRVFLVRMLIFLVIAAFVPFILYRQIASAFLGNPWLNGMIIFVLAVGIMLAFRSVILLMPEVEWVNTFRLQGSDIEEIEPRLLAPMATLLRDRDHTATLSTSTWRSLLDSIANRLDENREILRYMTGLLVFLGLLGTFWGLLTTIAAVGDTIQSLNVSSGDTNLVFEELKSGLAAPLSGMAIAFSSSLFGLAGSLVLGFLDLQTGQAQIRFYTELEDWLSTLTDLEELEFQDEEAGNTVREIRGAVDRLSRNMQDGGSNKAATAAMANLAEGIQSLVQHMRSEQQIVRDWMEAQSEQQQTLNDTLGKLARLSGSADAQPGLHGESAGPDQPVGDRRGEG
ncbi:MAG: flagellar motor protein MotA [Alphaproteobacteria bacterium]|nr:MAG: flagellar motor protein MotA [Alphaproteobacteria bacterium]